MKKLVVVILLVLAAVWAAPRISERLSRQEDLTEMVGDLGEHLEDKGDELLSRLKEYFSSHESGEIAEHLRSIFSETETLSDEELEQEIRAAAEGVSLHLSDEQVAWLRGLCRRYEKVDETELRSTVEEWKEKISSMGSLEDVADKLRATGEKVRQTTQEAGEMLEGVQGLIGSARDMLQSVTGTGADTH